MSKHLIHFQDQLAATTNPDPVLQYLVFEDGHYDPMTTKKSNLVSDLVGMRFERFKNRCPVFVSELVGV